MATNAVGREQGARLIRTDRVAGLALACVLVGSTTYAAIAWRSGPISHEYRGEDVRFTSEAFDSWRGVIPAPDISERSYREIRLPSGEWVKDGHYGRRTREGFALEEGSYRASRRSGRWTFWNLDGSIDVERSGIYADDVRVKPGPTTNTDLAWYLDSHGS